VKNCKHIYPLILLAAIAICGCSRETRTGQNKETPPVDAAQNGQPVVAQTKKAPDLLVHVGGTMRPVMKELISIYSAETGEEVEINSAGSGELLAGIELRKEGDIYVCHDPFLEALMDRGLGLDGWVISELVPCIVVQKGNPRNIAGLKDLVAPDVELYLTDYKHSTLGRILGTIFAKAGIDFDQLNREKVIHTNKSGGYVANMVKMKNADAAMCWEAVAVLRLDGLEMIKLPEEHLPVPHVDAVTSATGKRYVLCPIRVTLATLKCSNKPVARDKFAAFVVSDKAKPVFTKFGYRMGAGKKLYEVGKALK